VLLFGEGDRVDLTWDGGRLSFDVPAADAATGETVRLLRGSRLITDWESRYPKEEWIGVLQKRRESRVAARLADLSQTYGLASREMSLVAVVKRSGDRPGELPDTRVVPVGMAQDVPFGAYFDAGVAACASAVFAPVQPSAPAPRAKKRFALFDSVMPAEASLNIDYLKEDVSGSVDNLVSLAGMLEPDGGMPGKTMEFRTARSIALLLAFVAAGHTQTAGVFRAHVQRLVDFLKSLNLSAGEIEAVRSALGGTVPAAPWENIALDPRATRAHVAAALRIK
jgi:hypothetical protein